MTSKTLQRSDLTPHIAAWRGGTGPSLVLIHGVGLQAEAWTQMVPYLLPHFSLTLIDLPGHGESVPFAYKPDLVDYTQRLVEAINQIESPSFIVGHSMGALLAMELAIHAPEKVSAIAPLNAIFRRAQAAKATVAQRANEIGLSGPSDPTITLERWFGSTPTGAMKQAADKCRDWLTHIDPTSYAHAYTVFAQEDGPSEQALADIICPALFITGSDEPNSTPAMSQALAGHVAQGSANIIDKARHMMPMTHAEMVCTHLIQFHQNKGERDEQA